MNNMINYKHSSVIGLEVHVELKTKSKMFCGCSADYFGAKPNTHVCPVCLGLPGSLPVPNKKAIEWCIMIGIALNCRIPLFSKFDRKNYFYPDLPKGYQISQYDKPLCVGGHVILNKVLDLKSKKNETPNQASSDRHDKRKIRIRRVHMEEDTAKLLHSAINGEKVSLIDFNRSGVPLVEIVTEPDFQSASEVVEYLKKLQQIIKYLNVSDADMEKGQMRLEPNISLSLFHSEKLPLYKVEVKNINSFRFVEKSINYEIERQKKVFGQGKIPAQETRGWDEKRKITISQRVKEESHDYRYFPEPDIPPIRFAQNQISKIKDQIGELPDQKIDRFQKEYGLSEYDSEILTREKETADYFEEACRDAREISNKDIANWIVNKKADTEKTLPAELVKKILESKKIETVDTQELEAVIQKVIKNNPKANSDYKKGKVQVIGFLIGKIRQVYKKGDIKQIKRVLEENLKK